MLRAKALTPLLQQLNTHGIKSSMLLASDGRLLCYSSSPDFLETDRIIGSVAAHAFAEYQSAARTSFDKASDVEFMLMELELGNIAVMPMTETFLLCCYTDTTASLSDVKAKLGAARAILAGPLSSVGVLGTAALSAS